jgi:predicted enzyme involved in methoxymalonyl-ACP biosynthesis
VALEVQESYYGQYRQEILDPASRMYGFDRDLNLLAVHKDELALSGRCEAPRQAVEEELARWTSLWQVARRHSRAGIIQHNFVVDCQPPLGHLSAKLEGCRYALMQALNARLGLAADERVAILDCDRLASQFGKTAWRDPRYWHLAKQAVSFEALPLLSRHTAVLIAAVLGASRKCLALDLNDTLWGEITGEDGLHEIRLGSGPEEEAYCAFQEQILALKEEGVLPHRLRQER